MTVVPEPEAYPISYPYPEAMTEEDIILRKTYAGISEGPFHTPIPYSAVLDIAACTPAWRERYRHALADLRTRDLVNVIRDDDKLLCWRLTLQGVEYANERLSSHLRWWTTTARRGSR